MIAVSSNFLLLNVMNAKGKQNHFCCNQHIKYNEGVKLDMKPKG